MNNSWFEALIDYQSSNCLYGLGIELVTVFWPMSVEKRPTDYGTYLNGVYVAKVIDAYFYNPWINWIGLDFGTVFNTLFHNLLVYLFNTLLICDSATLICQLSLCWFGPNDVARAAPADVNGHSIQKGSKGSAKSSVIICRSG